MQTYLVGGAVRDRLMGKEPNDLDFVVVGATEQEMLDAGFKNVGESFPVFLHPETGEEYALARRERKTGVGYTGFSVEFNRGFLNPDLTQKFVELGYDLENEYSVQELMEVFRRIGL